MERDISRGISPTKSYKNNFQDAFSNNLKDAYKNNLIISKRI